MQQSPIGANTPELESVVASEDGCEYGWEYELVSATCSSLQFSAVSSRGSRR